MISVILFGRNDSYGYNLHKRTAISLNCIAEVLTNPGDEIIFVDCNTPDDMPTLAEAISDTLTSQTKKLLRVIRLRPEIYEWHKQDSPLKVHETLCRNVAIRRSDPQNRWVLSTNTDLVFVSRNEKKSLSDVAAELADGFYALPRFEMPESLWEQQDRTRPQEIIRSFARWGKSLHLNEMITVPSLPFLHFENAGDFQLMLRDQVFAIHGFHEGMSLVAHMDSNIAKRFYLLNGEVKSLLDQFYAYHCGHMRCGGTHHDQAWNSWTQYVQNVTSPYLPEQEKTWGIPDEQLEEIRLNGAGKKRFSDVLENLLPGMETPYRETSLSYNHALLYDTFHVFPFAADYLSTVPTEADIGYFGNNEKLLALIGRLRKEWQHDGRVLYDENLLMHKSRSIDDLPELCVPAASRQIFSRSHLFIFDAGMNNFPRTVNEIGQAVPLSSTETERYAKQLQSAFIACVQAEAENLLQGNLPRKFVFVGVPATWFEALVIKMLGGIVRVQYSGRIRHGFLQPEQAKKVRGQIEETKQLKQASAAIIWEGSQFVTHSLALINREICIRLAQSPEIDLSIIPYEPHQFDDSVDPRFKLITKNLNRALSRSADIHVRHQWPPNFTPPAEGHWVIIQPWEFGSLPVQWIREMSAAVDEIWTYTRFVRECYIRSGISADQIYLVPLGVNTKKFSPAAPIFPLKTGKRFKFLFVGGTIHRKGIDLLLDAYGNTFTAADDVCLVIKDMGGDSFYKGKTAIKAIRQLQAIPEAPEIEYIDRILSEDEMAGLYTACDCLVHPYRGEGFGLPIAEAMACELPVIVTGYGAALDFCDQENAYLIPAREMRFSEKKIGNLETVDFPFMAEPDREALKQLMLHVLHNPAEAKMKGEKGKIRIENGFTWEDSYRAVQQRIAALRDKPVKRFRPDAGFAIKEEFSSDKNWQDRLNLAEKFFNEGKLALAESILREILDNSSDHHRARNDLACLLWQKGEKEDAVAEIRKAFEKAPNDRDIVWNAGQFVAAVGFLDEALEIYRNFLDRQPGDAEIEKIVREWEELVTEESIAVD